MSRVSTCWFHYVIFLLGWSLTTAHAQTPTITTGTVSPAAVCVGGTISVPFTTTGRFGAGNTFTAQLSNPDGSFSASPRNIGTGASPIEATIPADATPGSRYRVRVVSSNPVVASEGSGNALTISAIPNSPGVTSPQTTCQSTTPYSLSATGQNIKWYATATSQNPVETGPTYSVAVSSAGTRSYYVSQTVNGCESDRAEIRLTVTARPNRPSTSPRNPCQSTDPYPITAIGENLKWYTSADSPTPVFEGQSYAISISSPGETTYYVSQTVNGCESDRAPLVVTVKASPALPTVRTPDPYCQGAPAQPLSATPLPGATLRWWGTNETGGSPSLTPPTPPTNTPGTQNYYVSQILNDCESPRAVIRVVTKRKPTEPGVTSPVTRCQGQPSQPLTATGQGLLWYATATGGSGSPNAPEPPTTSVGTQAYYVSQTEDGCESNRARIDVQVNAVPAAPAATNPRPYCEGAPASPLTATGQNLLWYTTETGGTGTSAAPTPNTNVVGPQLYYVSQTINRCESRRTTVTVTINDTPGQPGVAPVTYCQQAGAQPLTASAGSGNRLAWYGTRATGGDSTGTAPTPSTTSVGTTNFYVSQTTPLGCEGPRAALPVRVNPKPGQPGVTPVAYCNNAPSQPLTAQGSNLRWFGSNGEALPGTPTPPTNVVGDQTYLVTQTNADGCESDRQTLRVTINAIPAAPGVANLAYCQAQQDQPGQDVRPLTADGQNLRWFNSFGDPFPGTPTPPINAVQTLRYQVSQTVNNCESQRSVIVVDIRTTPAPTVETPTVSYCQNETARPLVATGQNLRWIDPYGRVTETAPTPATTNVSPRGGDAFFVYQIGDNGCRSARTTIRVIVNSVPTLALMPDPATTSVNLGQNATLRLRFTGVPPYTYTLSDSTKNTTTDSVTTVQVLPRQTTTYQVVRVSNSCGVGLPGNPATATITVRIPTITTANLTSTTLCAGASVAVPFSTTGEFNAGSAFQVQLVNTTGRDSLTLTNTTVANGVATTLLPTTLAGGNYAVRVIATNPRIPVLGSNSPTPLSIRPLPVATLSGNQDVYETYPATLSIALVGDGPWTFTYGDSLRTIDVTTSQNPHRLEVRPARTTTYRLLNVRNGCGAGSVVGTATVRVLPLLATEDPLSTAVRTYPVPATTLLTVEVDVSLQEAPAVLTLTGTNGVVTWQHTTRQQRTELDVSRQPAGMYLLRVQVGNQHVVRRILKL